MTSVEQVARDHMTSVERAIADRYAAMAREQRRDIIARPLQSGPAILHCHDGARYQVGQQVDFPGPDGYPATGTIVALQEVPAHRAPFRAMAWIALPDGTRRRMEPCEFGPHC